jgi:hypothetical protein
MASTRECIFLCSKLLQNPEEIILWLKFDSDCFTLNSACTENYLVKWGNPHRLPKNKGIYREWGAFFDFGDLIEVPCGLNKHEILVN